MASFPNPTGLRHGVFNRLVANQVFVLPLVEVEALPILQAGALVYDKSDESVYVSNDTAWNLVGGPAAVTGNDVTLTSTGGTHPLVVDGDGPDLTILGLTAGTGTSLTTTAGVELTVASTVSLAPGGGGSSMVSSTNAPGAPAVKGLSVEELDPFDRLTLVQTNNPTFVELSLAPGVQFESFTGPLPTPILAGASAIINFGILNLTTTATIFGNSLADLPDQLVVDCFRCEVNSNLLVRVLNISATDYVGADAYNLSVLFFMT